LPFALQQEKKTTTPLLSLPSSLQQDQNKRWQRRCYCCLLHCSEMKTEGNGTDVVVAFCATTRPK
jgi:hypothetical protein